jgi:hypothetical protein
MTPVGFFVVFDDQSGCCAPMTLCAECEGALEYAGPQDVMATFATRALARRAINISKCYAKLRKTQGKIHNSDFLEQCKHLRIAPLGMV